MKGKEKGSMVGKFIPVFMKGKLEKDKREGLQESLVARQIVEISRQVRTSLGTLVCTGDCNS